MTGAGQRDRLVTFQRATVARDTLGVETETWPGTTLGTAWANVRYGTGQERRDAAALNASQVATFRVLANAVTAGVTGKDRISFDSLFWNITGNIPVGRAEREITAIAGKG